MNKFGVHSEVGKLRKVIVHRPELSLKRLTPSNHDDLLFDDAQFEFRFRQATIRDHRLHFGRQLSALLQSGSGTAASTTTSERPVL